MARRDKWSGFQFGRADCQFWTIVSGGVGAVGTANSSRLPSRVTPHSGNTPDAVNKRVDDAGANALADVLTATAMTEPSIFK